MRRIFSACLAFLLLFSVAACIPSCSQPYVYAATYLDTFDTVLNLSIPADSHEDAIVHAEAIHELLLDIHRDLDIYHHYDDRNNLYDLNEANGEALPVSKTILDVLTLGQKYYTQTNGRLNICLGSVLRLWHGARAQGDRIPDTAELTAALQSVSMDALVIDELTGTAQITDPLVFVDVGAIAKGYAMSRVQAYAARQGITSLLVNLGGHVLAIGSHPDGLGWSVHIRNPYTSEADTQLYATDLSVVTSGDYERTYTVNGQAYHHIIDPETGYPCSLYRAVTVTIPLSHTNEADALSTALFLMDRESGQALLAMLPGATAVWTLNDGTVIDSRTMGAP